MLPRGRPQMQQYPVFPGYGNYNQYPQNEQGYRHQNAPHYNARRRDRAPARPRNQFSYYSDESEQSTVSSTNTQISRGGYMPRGGVGRGDGGTNPRSTVKLKPTTRRQNERTDNPQMLLHRPSEGVNENRSEGPRHRQPKGAQKANIMRRDNNRDVMQTAQYFCPKCETNYNFRYTNNRYIGKIPLILHCSHSMCQECIYQNLKNYKVNCSVCLNDSTLTQEQTPVCQADMQTVFLPNFYILGAISYYKPLGGHLNNLENIAFVSTQSKKTQLPLPDPSDCCCFATCSKLATMFCLSCEGIYCSECCIVVHKSTKKLMSHEPIPRHKQKFSLMLENCGEHSSMQVEFFCKTCELAACCYCVLDKHTEHDRVPLYHLSPAEMEEFKSHKKSVETALKEVLSAQKKAARLANFDTGPVKKDMRRYFVDCHGKLETLEKKLCDELEVFKATNRGLDNIQRSLEASAEELKQLVAFNEDNVGDKKLNLRAALNKLRSIETIPRFLLNENGQTEPVKFTANYKAIDSWEEDFTLEKCEDSEYKLVTEKELPHDYSFDNEESETEINETISAIVKKFNQSIDVSSSISNTNDLPVMLPVSATSSLKSKKTTDRKESTKRKLDMERVDVQHINSMDSFFMQYKSDQSKLEQLNKDIKNYVKLGGAQAVPQPQLGDMYLALYINESPNHNQKEQKWCRARLTEIKNGENGPLYELFFIDYGKTQIVDGNRIKGLPGFLMQKKPFAIEGKLHNPRGVNWNKSAHYSLAKILNGKDVYMMEKSYNQGTYEVDLMIASSDGGVTSVTDILSHAHTSTDPIHEDAVSLDDSFSAMKEGYFPILKLFPNSNKFTKHQKDKVVIATVVDPHNIFVHMVQHQEAFKSLNREIKQMYKKVKSSGCIPIEGTYVIVEYKDPIRSNWHRALIKRVDLNNDRVHVLLVDWGLNVVVSHTSIRTLQESFTKLECQAVLVKLTHIAPYDKQFAWSSHAINFLQTYYRSQEVLKMVVQEVEPELEVVLFDVKSNLDICLNALMVENNLADSTGYISLKVNWPQLEANNPEFSEEDGLMSSLLKKVDEQAGDDSEEEDLSGVKKRQVDVVKIEGPDLIWLKFLEYRDKEREMFRNLQIHYSQEKNIKESWETGELCVTEVGHEFARGKIVEKVDEKDYKIYLLDKVQEIVSPIDKIYVHDKYFANYRQAVIKSHLANIRPAGDTGKWSSSSIEALQEIFIKNKRIYASKASESDTDPLKKSLPVDMWYGRVIQGGPLDPDRMKYVSINKSLVKLGFAYNVRPITPKPITSKLEIEENLSAATVAEGDLSTNAPLVASQKLSTEEKIVASPKSKDSKSELANISEETKEKSIQSIDNSQLFLDNWNAIVDRELSETIIESNSELQDTNPEDSDAISLKSSESHASVQHKNEMVISDWLPPFRFTKKDFQGRVTCVETGGHMYLHEQELDDVYYKMESSMKQYFDSNRPDVHEYVWQPGDLCTIKYTDGNWYRGKVLKILSKREVSVMMIDFGSDHNLSTKDIFRELLYIDIRPFATKVKLDKVYSKSKGWLTSDYDHFHNLVTDWCRIVINGPVDVEQPLVDVYNENGVYINQKLVELCPNLSRCSNFPIQGVDEEDDPIVIESLESEEPYNNEALYMDAFSRESEGDQTALEYKTLALPQDFLKGKKIIMEIGGVLNFDRITFRVPEADVSEKIYDLVIELQSAVDNLPNLKEFAVGTPCLAPFSEDGVWYRARITGIENIDEEVVNMMFVDYGNSESVSIEEVKTILPDHLILPQQSWEASLNVTLEDASAIAEVMQFFKSLERKRKYVKLVKENPLTVDLYEKNDALCYDKLINSGALRRLEDAIP